MANFQRTKYYAYKKLGSGQKSKMKYRRATGRHNKIRQKWRSKPPMVEIGYKNKANERGLINEKMPVLVYNVQDLLKVGKENIAMLGKIGMKNKIEIAREASSKNIEIANLNVRKLLKMAERNKKTYDNKKQEEKKR
jgi:large subunit ribosomal protein L32e